MSDFDDFRAALLLYAKANNIEASAYRSTANNGLLCVTLPLVDIHHEPEIKAIASIYGNIAQAIDGSTSRLYFFDLKR